MSDTSTLATGESEANLTTEVLQRLVLPADADYDTLPLYVEKGEIRPRPEIRAADDVESEAYEQVHPDLVTGRHSHDGACR